jgi:hypothetical protein
MAWVTVKDGVPTEAVRARPATLNVRNRFSGWLCTDGTPGTELRIAPAVPECRVDISYEDHSVVKAQYWLPEMATVKTYTLKRRRNGSHRLQVPLPPRAADYRVTVAGGCRVQIPEETPLVVEASWARSLALDKSGPLYFYVPRGNRTVVFRCSGTLALRLPGENRSRAFTVKDCVAGKDYVVLEVPAGAAGKVWRLDAGSAGTFGLYNVPAYLSPYRDQIVVPVDIATGDDLAMGWAE